MFKEQKVGQLNSAQRRRVDTNTGSCFGWVTRGATVQKHDTPFGSPTAKPDWPRTCSFIGMQRLNNILVATDFSESSQAAVTMASNIAQKNDTDLHLIHVQELLDTQWLDQNAKPLREYQHYLFNQAFDQLLASHPEIQEPVQRKVISAPKIDQGILDYAKEHACECIVLGTHARKGMKRWFIGSVAESIATRANIPVVIVGSESERVLPLKGFKKMMVGTDFQNYSQHYVQQALEIAKRHQAELSVLHVAQPIVIPEMIGSGATADVNGILLDNAKKQMHALEKALGPQGHPISYTTMTGYPADILCHQARTEKIDLLVVGATHVSGLDRWMLGSTAAKVIRQAPCPVLVLPPGDGANI